MEQLVKEAIKGDHDAFGELLRLEKPRLLAKAISYTGNRQEAEDIVQETVIKAYKSVHQLREPDYFSTWIFKILIHESYALLNKRKRSLAIEVKLMNQAKDAAESSPSAFDSLHEAVAGLKKDHRTAIILHYFYDFTVVEISFMLDKPTNTIKTYLYRGRRKLKQQLKQSIHMPISIKGMTDMLKEELAKLAISFVQIPKDYELIIEDYQEERTTYIWANEHIDDGVSVAFDSQGRLVELTTKPAKNEAERKDFAQKQAIAEQFLLSHHKEALNYLSITNVVESKDRTKFIFEQLAGGEPLQSYYTTIEVADNGEVIHFSYNGYTRTPPCVPPVILAEEDILSRAFKEGEWKLELKHLSEDIYDGAETGLLKIYTHPAFTNFFDPVTGEACFREEETEMDEEITPFPKVMPGEQLADVNEIIGIPDTMELDRVQETDDEIWQVWLEKDGHQHQDRSLAGFFLERTENTVKVKIDKETGQLKEFIWFKDRVGSLDLGFEECKDVACCFLATYFEQFIPYLGLQIHNREFNETNRAFFTFPLHDESGIPIDGEQFYIAVNRTTGQVDLCNGPDLSIGQLKVCKDQPVISTGQITASISQIDAQLAWSYEYEGDELSEKLKFQLCKAGTKNRIAGINAVSGEVISVTL